MTETKVENAPSTGASVEAKESKKELDADPHNLRHRFVENQMGMFEQALSEISQGAKESCWLWFIMPTAPYIVDGVEKGSSLNRRFALRGDDAVKAYLEFPPQVIPILDNTISVTVHIRRNYLRIATEILSKMEEGSTLKKIFGFIDAPKAKSSLELFHRIASEIEDKEIATICGKILEFKERTCAPTTVVTV